jgi:hypothetical protein
MYPIALPIKAERRGIARRGVALIMVAAVLSILAALATGFFTLVTMQTKSATRYSDSVRAEMIGHAGIDFAIAHLREQAFKKAEDPTDPWYMVNYLDGAKTRASYPDSILLHNGIDDDFDGLIDNLAEALVKPQDMKSYSMSMGSTTGDSSDRFVLQVADAAGKININSCDNLGVVLDNL